MLNLKFKNKYKKNVCLMKSSQGEGFTLIEMLVAVSIFSMSVIAFMSVLSSGISDTNYAKNKTIAAFLAVEGIEYTRNIRDSFVNHDATPEDGWQKFKTLMSTCIGPNGCHLGDVSSYDINEVSPVTVSPCNIGNNCSLYYYPNTGRYSYDHAAGGGSDSGFTRSITVTPIGADEVKISSTVTWFRSSISYSVSFSDNLLKWKE